MKINDLDKHGLRRIAISTFSERRRYQQVFASLLISQPIHHAATLFSLSLPLLFFWFYYWLIHEVVINFVVCSIGIGIGIGIGIPRLLQKRIVLNGTSLMAQIGNDVLLLLLFVR